MVVNNEPKYSTYSSACPAKESAENMDFPAPDAGADFPADVALFGSDTDPPLDMFRLGIIHLSSVMLPANTSSQIISTD